MGCGGAANLRNGRTEIVLWGIGRGKGTKNSIESVHSDVVGYHGSRTCANPSQQPPFMPVTRKTKHRISA